MSLCRRDISVPRFLPIPCEIQRNLKAAIARMSLTALGTGEQHPLLKAQSANIQSESDPRESESTVPSPLARPITTLLDGKPEAENLSAWGSVQTIATLGEVINWTADPMGSSDSLSFIPNGERWGTMVLPALKQRGHAPQLEQRYQELIRSNIQKPDVPAAIWSDFPVPYRSNHPRTGERFLCSKNGDCKGNPAEYRDNGEPIQMRPGRYGGKDAVSRKKEAERGLNLKLCAACYLEVKAGQK